MDFPRPLPPEGRAHRAPPRRGLKDQLVEAIGSDIIAGRYPPGALLPSEGDLLARFSVSRTVLREAITVLSAKGLIDVRQKRGTMVRPNMDWNQLDPSVIRWSGEPGVEWAGGDISDRIDQLVEVRFIVEPAAAALAARRAAPEDLERMRAAYAAMESAGADVQAFMAADLEFHIACLRASRNAFLLPLAHAIRSAMMTSLQITASDPNANFQVSLPLHRAILDAVLAGEPDAAAQAMTAHLEDIPNRRNGFARSARQADSRETAQ